MLLPPLTIAVKDHLRKSLPYAVALHDAGHDIVAQGPADVLLIDLDTPLFGYRSLIDRYKAMGAKVLLYPHGAGPVLVYDGLFEPYPEVDANLVIGSGNAELLRRLEYPTPTHVTGWALCGMRPFRATRDVRRVLFAPTHPNGDGSIAEAHLAANARAYEQLLAGPWSLHVRHIGTLEQNGLWPADGVQYTPGTMDPSHADIDSADAVVAGAGTYPLLAIARGVPTLMYGQVTPPNDGRGNLAPLSRRERYEQYVRYPFDLADGPLDEVLHAAAAAEGPIADWKRRFVGARFDPRAFAALVERLVRVGPEPIAIDPTRAFTTVALADELCERPELLATYASAVSPDDDATLIVWGPGFDEAGLVPLVLAAAEAAGLDEARLPDVLVLPMPSSADAHLAQRADALLSEWPAAGRLGALPRLGVGQGPSIAAAVRRTKAIPA